MCDGCERVQHLSDDRQHLQVFGCDDDDTQMFVWSLLLLDEKIFCRHDMLAWVNECLQVAFVISSAAAIQQDHLYTPSQLIDI